jgi:hypothetical protein
MSHERSKRLSIPKDLNQERNQPWGGAVILAYIDPVYSCPGMPPGTSVSQAVEELDNLQSQLDTGNSELIQEDSFLVQLLANDAAGLSGHTVGHLNPSTHIMVKSEEVLPYKRRTKQGGPA